MGLKQLKQLLQELSCIELPNAIESRHDRYVAYNFFDSSKRQICWAHLKRAFTKLAEKQDKLLTRIGKDLLECQAKLFDFWHQYKQELFSREELIRKTRPIRTKKSAV